jgi:hypothetical protein
VIIPFWLYFVVTASLMIIFILSDAVAYLSFKDTEPAHFVLICCLLRDALLIAAEVEALVWYNFRLKYLRIKANT